MFIPITTQQEFDLAIDKGFDPLIDKRFNLEINLRVQIQNDFFRKDKTKYFKYCFSKKSVGWCEECGLPLRSYSACFVSHLLTKRPHPEKYFDPRNNNIVCLNCHQTWETGNREGMKIFERNQITIQLLKKEYNEFKKTA